MSKFRKFRKKTITKSTFKIAKKALRRVKRLERKVEVKVFDVVVNNITPTVAGIVVHINAIAQGDGIVNRDGLASNCIGFKLNYQINNTVISATRIMIVRDNRQIESTDPSVLDVILSADPLSQKSRVNPKRFTIYYDQVHEMDPDDTTRLVRRRFFKKKFEMRWVGATGTSQTRNGLYLIANTDAAANEPTVKFSFRMWFTDM